MTEPQAHMAKPTARQEKFVKALVAGNTAEDAKKLAGYGKTNQCNILKSRTVQSLMAKAKLLHPDVIDGVVAKHMLGRDAGIALKAADIGNKVKGRYVTKIESTALNINASVGEDVGERLGRMMAERQAERKARRG